MDFIKEWISVIGSIASVGAAIWAFIEAGKAKKSASKAEIIRGEIVERRKLVEVSQVYAETRRILKTVAKVGPTCNASLIRGVNCANIAGEVEEYCRFINEQSSHFTAHVDNQAKELCKLLRSEIEQLAEAITFEEKKKFGKSIYYLIDNFIPLVKNLTDDKKENVTML